VNVAIVALSISMYLVIGGKVSESQAQTTSVSSSDHLGLKFRLPRSQVQTTSVSGSDHLGLKLGLVGSHWSQKSQSVLKKLIIMSTSTHPHIPIILPNTNKCIWYKGTPGERIDNEDFKKKIVQKLMKEIQSRRGAAAVEVNNKNRKGQLNGSKSSVKTIQAKSTIYDDRRNIHMPNIKGINECV
jgi:hypothetical protein